MSEQPQCETIVPDSQSRNSQDASRALSVDRRMFLAGAAASTTGLSSMPASGQEAQDVDLAAALTRFRASIPPNLL
jgi:hypothetical protein